MRIVLASTNRGKLRELMILLTEPRIELVTLDQAGGAFEVPETGDTFEANARLKAEAVASRTGLVALADDSGLEVDALGGRPGVWSRRYAGESATDAENNARLLEELRGSGKRTARFRCVLALAVPDGAGAAGARVAQTVLLAEGTLAGRIAEAPRGTGGFGYDPVFIPAGLDERTLGEIAAQEKNALSHRNSAVRALAPQLSAWLDRLVDGFQEG